MFYQKYSFLFKCTCLGMIFKHYTVHRINFTINSTRLEEFGCSRDVEFVRWSVHEIRTSDDVQVWKWGFPETGSSRDEDCSKWGVQELSYMSLIQAVFLVAKARDATCYVGECHVHFTII